MLLLLASLTLDARQPDLGWLAGHWCTEPKNGTVICDSWAPMDKGVMHGKNISRTGGTVRTNETMTITVDELGMVFHAEPANQAPGDFRMATFDPAARSVTFEERSHDYPQRVRYRREGEKLLAEISMLDGSKAVRWTFHRTLE
ncbi:DUF6265 family protein [Sphingomonas sp. LM7]|uniref:DUF6265 family protein n=1 Tax=Sphingomonas sp. LM7 TaxID=1938607 RepID=UPI000983FC52|nr:DUF6265 family protein [Sphingomonas sp. LM7]AQR75263.1 hypothetical protein BXU08_17750 [Sphingomonas sp. LM7]